MAVDEKAEARRAFLKNCAQFAVAMPPAITLLVSTKDAFGDQECSFICQLPADPPPCGCVDGAAGTEGLSPSLFQELDPEINDQGQ